ncbi:hypothetical protein BDW60DRAFT_220158 [Aspergillus nidulans var. acristatus]
MTYHAPSLLARCQMLRGMTYIRPSKTYTDSVSQCFDEDRATRYTGALSICQFIYYCVYNQAIAGDVLGMELLLASATRFAYHLRGNIHPAKAGVRPSRLGAHIRNLFWLCYVFNQVTTMRTGLPPAIDDSSCDLTSPNHSEYAELLCTIREFDGHLEESVPSNSRPTFMSRPADAGSMHPAIHQASGRCKYWTDNQDTRHKDPALWSFYRPYLTAAMIHLFCNIIMYPREESSQSDLELIVGCDAPAAFRMQVKYVKDLCGEIQGLAHIAISSSNP